MLTAQEVAAALQPLLQPLLKTVGELHCSPITAGASADTWAVDASDAKGSPHRFILRRDAGGESFGTSIGKAAEARAQQQAFLAGVPVAEVLHVFENDAVLGNGYLMRRMPGESLAPRILKKPEFAKARQQLSADCAKALATIHAIPSGTVGFLPVQTAQRQLQDLYAMHQKFGEALPVFSLAHRYLQTHVPESSRQTLVHGDYRLGNFLVDEEGLVAVLDWELTHRGDPLEDIGWLCVNAWRFGSPLPVGGFASREDFLDAYEKASGVAVDPRHVLYWELFGTFKWGVICQYQAYTYLEGPVKNIERIAIGRRVAETEADMLSILEELCR